MKKILSFLLCIFSSIAFSDQLPDRPHVYVQGIHTVSVVPDMFFMSMRITKTDTNVSSATRDVEDRSVDLIKTLKNIGVKKEDITSSDFRITPRYKWVNRIRIFTGTEVSRTINVTLRDLTRYGDLIQAVVDANVGIIARTQLLYSKEEELRHKALVGAVKNAREKAALLLQSEHGEVGAVFSISALGGVAVPVLKMQSVSDAERSQQAFEPGKIEFTERVNVVFLIKRK